MAAWQEHSPVVRRSTRQRYVPAGTSSMGGLRDWLLLRCTLDRQHHGPTGTSRSLAAWVAAAEFIEGPELAAPTTTM